MAKQPRHHHYVPQFYLAGFTATGTINGTLHVLDREQQKSWPSTPRATAHARDYHAVDLGLGQDPMFVEKTMAVCEGKWATVLKAVVEGRALPQDDSLGDLLAFVAFLTVRVPRIRNQVTDFIDRASKAELRATFGTLEGREHFRAVIAQHCQTLPKSERTKIERILRDDPNLKDMADYVNSDQYTVSYDQTWNVQTMVQIAITLLPIFAYARQLVRRFRDQAAMRTGSGNLCSGRTPSRRQASSSPFRRAASSAAKASTPCGDQLIPWCLQRADTAQSLYFSTRVLAIHNPARCRCW